MATFNTESSNLDIKEDIQQCNDVEGADNISRSAISSNNAVNRENTRYIPKQKRLKMIGENNKHNKESTTTKRKVTIRKIVAAIIVGITLLIIAISLPVTIMNNSPTTTEETTTFDTGLCDIIANDTCYWFEIHDLHNVPYEAAEEICLNKTLVPAHFETESIYNAVVEKMRMKYNKIDVDFWTGIIVNTKTGAITSQDSFIKWGPETPILGGTSNLPNVFLYVYYNPDVVGMVNMTPDINLDGVICQRRV
ncbi:uncharacterized protein LOC120326594 [Styela clava]